ncbi:carbohydrate binding domain-containing protein [Marinoscillum furvescens]|uniref:Putative secreted protein (Por secretion system target) n=1 Tax=Marinoscillum furvescens DSM 4134 TaxID=1122208 RepID=A0A3D9L1C4_MARFU|nr:carbohydrate binding domain-containing protein [Marinoscillum furvescens]RED95943.1 putative secreted protein (Por secretion system target) [Marinoscillum furvescens DSM 4134]
MKNYDTLKCNQRGLLPAVLVLFCLLTSTLSYSATVNLNDFWDGTAGNLAAAFTSAQNAAGTNGTILLGAQTYNTTNQITITKTVTIKGAGKNSTIVKATGSLPNGLIQVDADGVTVEALTINCNGNAKHAIRTGKNNIPGSSKDLKCINLNVQNHKSKGIFAGYGNILNGLYVDGCDFFSDYDNAYPHIMIANRKWNQVPAPEIDPFTIKNSTFAGKGGGTLNAANSIEFDGGNDDVNIATDLKGSLITGCTFEKTDKWQISFVECINASITNCIFKGTTGAQNFAQPIHLEQLVENILIEGNQINQSNSGGDHIWSGGSDQGTPIAGPSNCIIRNNVFTGVARSGYFDRISTAADNNIIEDNDFSNATFTGYAVDIKGNNNDVNCNEGLSSSQVRFEGNGNSFTPYSSSCQGGSGGSTTITIASSPASVVTGESFDVTVNYQSSSQNEVVAIVNDPSGTWLTNDKQTVSAGSGSVTLTLSQSTAWAVANDYKLGVAIRPVGGNFGSNIDYKSTLFDVVSGNSTPTNFVENPGLETGDLTSWTGFGTRTVVTNAASGTYGVKVDGAGSHVQVITGLTPNTTYTYSANAKVQSGSSVGLGVKEYGGSEISNTITSLSYTQSSVTFTTGSSNTTAKIFFYVATAGNVAYGDDFSVVEGSSARLGDEGKTDQEIMVSEVSAFPNPLSGQHAKILLPENVISEIRIFNLSGTMIFSQSASGSLIVPYNTFGSRGMYLIQVQTENGIQSLKLHVE